MLTVWGMRELGKGRSLPDVKADMAKWMKKTTPEIKEMVEGSRREREARIADKVGEERMKDNSRTGRQGTYTKLIRKSDTNEWVVKVYVDGKYDEGRTYYTDDKQDAIDTQKVMDEELKESRIAERIVASVMHTANPMRGIHLDRSFYHPKDVAIETITPEGTDLDIRAYQQNGVWYGVAFAGRANRPLWHYRFRDRAQLDRRIDETVSDRRGHMDVVQKRQEERRNFKHSMKVGDILYSSWGYDQTQCDFFQVTEIGEKSVKIRGIGKKKVGPDSDSVVAIPDRFTGAEMLKIVGLNNTIRLTSYSSAYPWDGKPKYETPFGMGH
jgi:hypothetical protein